jgi:hypothetical protein
MIAGVSWPDAGGLHCDPVLTQCRPSTGSDMPCDGVRHLRRRRGSTCASSVCPDKHVFVHSHGGCRAVHSWVGGIGIWRW